MFIEVHGGDYLGEHDIERLDDDFGQASSVAECLRSALFEALLLRVVSRRGTVDRWFVSSLSFWSRRGACPPWRRRHAPVSIGEGIRALGRIGHYDNVPELASRRHPAARRRRQHVRLASSVCLCALAAVWIASSNHRGWAVLFACVLLLRVLFEMLARRPQNTP